MIRISDSVAYKNDQNWILTQTSETTKLKKTMTELKSFSALPKSTSVEIQTHISSTNFNNNGKLKIYYISHLSDRFK